MGVEDARREVREALLHHDLDELPRQHAEDVHLADARGVTVEKQKKTNGENMK